MNQTVILGQKFNKSGDVFEKLVGVPIYLFRAPFFENNLQVFLKFQRNDYGTRQLSPYLADFLFASSLSGPWSDPTLLPLPVRGKVLE